MRNISFEQLYITNYPKLKRFAVEYVLSEDDAEDIVQDVFLTLWANNENLEMPNKIVAFLYTATKNRCLDYLKHQCVVRKNTANIQMIMAANATALEALDQSLFEEDIEDVMARAINKLPLKCREIFIKIRIEGKKHKEVADFLSISVNTVENQMNIAYKKLRLELKKYL